MPSHSYVASSIIVIIIIIIITSLRVSADDPTYVYHTCSNTTYTRNSTYSRNLRTLLNILSTDTSAFQNTAAGNSPDMVNGLFLCRGDVPAEICRDCVMFAGNYTQNRCPRENEVLIWYDECMLRYSYRNFPSNSVTGGVIIMTNPKNVSSDESDRFNDLLVSTLNQAADEAVNNSRMFSVKNANFSANQTLSGLVQCTLDLTRQDCDDCLKQSINGLPRGRYGARLLLPSCNSRYELHPSNETAFVTPQPPGRNTVPPPPEQKNVPPPSEQNIVPPPSGKGGKSFVRIIIVAVAVAIAFPVFIAGYCFVAKRGRKTYDTAPADDDGDDITAVGSLQFDFKTIEAATYKFSQRNRLGQGGFGEVFKGTLPNGTEVAVKRLSKTSDQGENEFKNEVVLVAKLQHRNLVRLLGFCVEGEEKILVFEFVPNKSLDYFLFDTTRQGQLDWRTRYKIIGGITRGILYLHQDSRLTIIHRDLKASNILIDSNMNPKIADFGMARIFGMDQTEANTRRVVGTYGYMSPEYAMYGQFSMKSDVYSFGVLVLEIITGKKNSSFYRMDDTVDNLVTYAWRQWSNGSPLELVDAIIGEDYQKEEVIRCIHIGLLCVQEDPAKRPTLSTIHQMLTNFSINLPDPQTPGFFFGNGVGTIRSTNNSILCSINDATVTEFGPR